MVEPFYIDDDTFVDYLDRMRKIALSIFEWQNLPKSMDARFLERSLYFYGTAALLYDDRRSEFINTNSTNAGDINIYGLPTKIQCFSYGYQSMRKVYNGLSEYFDKSEQKFIVKNDKSKEAILVLNTWDRTSTAQATALFAYRLYEAQRACDVNIKAQKTPVMIITDENQRLTMKNIYEQYDGNAPVIYGDKSIDLNGIKALKTDAPFVADKLMEYKVKIWNEFLNYLGVNNLYEKKERVNVEETSINNEVINFNLQSFLAPRQHAADQFNELFNIPEDQKVTVRVRSDLYNIIKQTQSITSDELKNFSEINQQLKGGIDG